MENVLVAHSGQPNRSVTGWGASLAFHACLALVAFGLMPKMAVMVEKEPFTWDVALVEAPREVAREPEPAPAPQVQPPAPTPVKPRPQPVRAVEPPPQAVERRIETRVLPQAVQREVQPVVEKVRPQEQIQPEQEIVQMQQAKPIEPQEVHKTEPVVQAAAPAEVQREVAPVVEQQVMEAAPATAQTYQTQPVVSAPAVVETVPEPVMTASAPAVRTAPVVEAVAAPPAPVDPAPAVETVAAAVSEPAATPPVPVEPVAAAPAPAALAQPDPARMEEHQVVASAAIPKKAAKANNSWVGESLHRRISELRHYPSTARLNGWEGKVVLKVSIRNDGHLNSVEVVKSSGHESLDQAAIEAVRRACPLHMKHELSSEMVVLTLPVSYSLNR